MPSIPTYDAPVVAPRALERPDLASAATPELLSAGAEKDAKLGASMVAAGTGLAAVAGAMQQRANLDEVFRAETALKEGYLAYDADVKKNRQGQFSANVTADTSKWWQEQTQKAAEGITSPEARRVFMQRATGLRQTSLHAMSAFEQDQTQRAQWDAWNANNSTTISTAAQLATPEAVASARGQLSSNLRAMAAAQGWQGDTLNAEMLKQTTALHTAVFNNLVEKNYEVAKAYLTANKLEIDGKQWDNLEKTLREGGMDTLAQNVRDDVFTRGLTEAQAVEAVRQKYTGKEEEHIVAKLKQYYAEKKEALRGPVNEDIMTGRINSLARLQTDPRYTGADPDERVKMVQFLQTKQHNDLSRANAAESLAHTREQRRRAEIEFKGAPVVARLMDPQSLVAMNRNELLAYGDVIGPNNLSHVLARYDSLKASEAKLHEAKIDKQDFDSLADKAGFKPFDAKKSEGEKRDLNNLQMAVEQRIDALQRANGGKTLPREEKLKVMQQIIDDKVMTTGWIWNSEKAAFQLTPDEVKGAYVMVAPADGKGAQRKVMLTEIDPAWQTRVVAQRARIGLPVDTRTIATLWASRRAPADPAKAVPQ